MTQQVDTSEVWLTFNGTVDSAAVGRFFAGLQGLLHQGTQKAHLLIHSIGGNVGDGLVIYNVLKNVPFELITYNAGAVESIAVLVYLAGRVRRAAKCSTFMLHKCKFPLLAAVGAVEMAARTEVAKLGDENVEAILRSEISLPDEKWATHATSDLVFGSAEAVSYKLVHEIANFEPQRGKLFSVI